jgi:DNA topoisomerase-1
MGKNLVIVESPAKAKTIEGYLGGDFVVRSSYGHIRDLPGGKLAVDVENGFMPTYELTADKGRFSELKKLAKSAETVWLATDEDREGEAIS